MAALNEGRSREPLPWALRLLVAVMVVELWLGVGLTVWLIWRWVT